MTTLTTYTIPANRRVIHAWRLVREGRTLTQRQAADLLGITRQGVAMIERNALRKIARHLPEAPRFLLDLVGASGDSVSHSSTRIEKWGPSDISTRPPSQPSAAT